MMLQEGNPEDGRMYRHVGGFEVKCLICRTILVTDNIEHVGNFVTACQLKHKRS